MYWNRIRWGVLGALFVALLVPVSAQAQGVSSLLTRLQQMEERLQQIEASRSNALAQVQNQLDQIIGAQQGAEEGLEDRLASLEASMSALVEQNAASDNQATTEVVHAMAQEIAALAQMVEALAQQEEQAAGGGGGSPESPEQDHSSDQDQEPAEASEQEEEHASDEEDAHGGHGDDQVATLPSGIQLTGFVDAAYTYGEHEAVSSTFALEQIEVNLFKALGDMGSLRFDLDWSGHGGEFDIEQGFVTLSPIPQLTFTLGKFNAPIGFESLDPTDMYQFSHALVFNYGLPTNLTGAMVEADLGAGFDLKAHVSNGWDQVIDHYKGKTIGGRLGYTYGVVSVGLSGMMDPSDSGGDEINVIDSDLSVAVTDQVTFGAEYNWGNNTIEDETLEWSGFLLMANMNLDSHGFTIRFDQFDDTDGSRLSRATLSEGEEGALAQAAGEVRRAIAFSPSVNLGGGMHGLFELRYDWSDSPVFLNQRNQLVESGLNVAFELLYTF